ncbi:MAG: restriction endonuclease subunit S, partial [Candidatus Methylumidiphilus sp.]
AGFEQGELIPQYSTVLRGAGSKDEEQAFLGYKWSQRRGAEGMVFLREPYDGGLLYTPGAQQRDEQAGKAAYYLRRAFQNLDHETPPENAPLHDKLRIAPTSAYFDFTRTGCDLAVNLAPSTADTSPVFDTRYPLAQLGDIAEIEQGQSPPSSAYNRDGNGLLFFQGSKDFGEYELIHSGVWTTEVTRKAVKGDLLMSVRAPVGELNRNPFQEICIGRGLAKLTPSKAINPLYFYHCLNVQKENIIGHKNLGFASISKREIEEIPIPLPPIEVQQRIVQAIEAIEAAEKKARESIATAQQAIETALLLCEGINPIQLNKLALINPPKIVEGLNDDSPISFIEMASVSDKGGLLNVATRHYGEVKTGYTNFIQGDIILAKITPCMENGKIAYLDSLPSQIGFGSTEFFVIRTNNKNTAKVIYHYLNRPAFRKPAERAMTGASGHRRVPKDFLEQFLLPDLSPTEQQNLLDEITRHEAQRAAAETELAAAPAKKRQILLDGIK